MAECCVANTAHQAGSESAVVDSRLSPGFAGVRIPSGPSRRRESQPCAPSRRVLGRCHGGIRQIVVPRGTVANRGNGRRDRPTEPRTSCRLVMDGRLTEWRQDDRACRCEFEDYDANGGAAERTVSGDAAGDITSDSRRTFEFELKSCLCPEPHRLEQLRNFDGEGLAQS